MSDMVPEVLNAALDSLFTPKEPGEQEYQGVDGLLYCRNCHTPVQCRVKLWGRDKIVPCLCRCQQEAMAEKKRQDELVERQRKIRQLKATSGMEFWRCRRQQGHPDGKTLCGAVEKGQG